DRWLLITVFQGWAKSEMYIQDLKAGTPPVEITSGKDFLYSGEIYQNKLYITTNEDAPRSRVLVVDAANPKRENWTEIVPQSDAVLQNTAIVGGKLGAQFPMFFFHRKGLELNGHNPTLLTGYGGFNISLTPSFVGGRYIWLEHGGIFAVANLRGGAEFGEDWHQAGMLQKKQNVFDDF